MVSVGSYLLSTAILAVLVLSLGFSAVHLRRRLLPDWEGAPAHLVEAIVAIALLIWLSELLGSVNLLYGWLLVATSLFLATAIALFLSSPTSSPTTGPVGESAWAMLITVGVITIVFAHWGLTIKDALDRGIFNFDSLWYHMPTAADIAQSHSVTGVYHTDPVFTTWFYPQNSELLHAVGILFAHRDTLSLFLNLGWLAIAFLAAWCIGRPYGRGPLSVAAVAILLECHTLVVREPGAAKDDLATATPLLAAIAILVTAWAMHREEDGDSLPPGWSLAAAGLAAGLAAGTKFTVLAMAAALSLAVVALAPAGRRRAAAAWWFLPALAGGGFWYLRNLIVAGNPLPMVAHLGPLALPHPEGLRTLRPDFSIAHYATDTAVWRGYFAPGLHQAFGALWPLVVAGAITGGLLAVLGGRSRIVRWVGAVALLGMVAYVFMPLSAAGAEGAPDAFSINVRYAVPAMLVGLAILPLSRAFDERRRQWLLLAVLLVVLVLTDRSDAILRDPSRLFALGLATLLVLVPAGIVWGFAVISKRHLPAVGVAGGTAPGEASATAGGGGSPAATGPAGSRRWSLAVPMTVLGIAILAIGYPVERSYLRDRYLNDNPETSIPGMHFDSAYTWARDVHDSRIGLAGTTAGFLQYGFFGTALSNQVRYLGLRGPHGAFTAIPDCRGFRAAVDAAHLDYLVTAPFLDFIHPGEPIPSPEPRWLRGETAVTPLLRSGPVTVWRVRGRLDPAACGPANTPLRRIPQQPKA
jgi:hypothetical protein